MSTIVIITTGGTIAMRRVAAGGAVPQLNGEELVALLGPAGEHVRVDNLFSLPGGHLTTAHLHQLVQRVAEHARDPEVAGIVVTHGTDTLEETAMLLDLALDTPTPVVLTGAMRTASAVGYDGPGNLAAAIAVARAPQARGQGVLVAFNDRIWAGSEVQKIHGQAVDAFGAPGSGPLGTTCGGEVRLLHRIAQRTHIPLRRLVEPVDLLTATQAGDERLLRAAIDSGTRGLVLETLGSGRVPPWWLPALETARARQLPVVVCSRTGAGAIGDEYGYPGATHDLRRLGCLFAHGLNGPKARIKLMLALGAVTTPDQVAQFFH
ncbi:asparaginase [Kallotenue papyrolyticum]|uniref:asparaginase n=1 Tax=Kallotenue papyrolyticum TaxID=1325125 RepID=UPI000492BAF5|nr:asparaginase [Kallotenue papyrolyticum]